jgi:CheY-like chemotaxis protein
LELADDLLVLQAANFGGTMIAARETDSHGSSLGLPTVLVVEDEVLIRLEVSEYLRGQGFRVLETANADEAKELLSSGERIEVLFSDVSMPGSIDGLELAYWVRENQPWVEVILTSGNSRPEIRDKWDGILIEKTYDIAAVALQIRLLLQI